MQASAIGQFGTNRGMTHHTTIGHGSLIPGCGVTGITLSADRGVRGHSTQRLLARIGIQRARAEQHAATLDMGKNNCQQGQRHGNNTSKSETT